MSPEDVARHERTMSMLRDAIARAHERAEREKAARESAAERRRRRRRFLPFLPA